MSHSVIDAPGKNPPHPPTESIANDGDVRASESAESPPGFLHRGLSQIVGSIGPAIVLVGFAAVFYFGHHNDWKLPKFAELTGTAEHVVTDWCEEHSVPESMCVECDSTLLPREIDYGWCDEHGVHNCTLHHPDVAQLKETPLVLADDFERASRALAVAERKKNNSACEVYKARIQFASIESVRQSGVDVELVDRQAIEETVQGSGEIVYDPTRQASLASRVRGSVWTVEKNVGDAVSRGDVLAIVNAAVVGELKTSLLRSLAEEKLQQQNVARLHDARTAIAGSRILDAEAALEKAHADVLSVEQSLRNLDLPVQVDSLRGLTGNQILDELRLLGIPDSVREKLGPGIVTANLLPIRSPIDGVVVERVVSRGEVVDPSRILFQVADIRQMWLTLHVGLEEIGQLEIGQTVRFRADGSREVVEGRLDWISTSADKTTRMVQVRAVLPNADGRLRNETFGSGKIVLRQEPNAIVIPNGSSHWEGCCQIVFVRDRNYFNDPDSPKVFHVRSVRLGASGDKFTEVISGVLPGEVIATEGSDVLRAQLLKNNLGAGCDCVAE